MENQVLQLKCSITLGKQCITTQSNHSHMNGHYFCYDFLTEKHMSCSLSTEQINPSSSAASHIIMVCSKIADIAVLCLLVIFFVSFLAFDYEFLGFHDPPIAIPHESEQYFEVIPWMIFGVLLFYLYLKHIIVGRNLKLRFKHHWLDISMAAFVPTFCL